MMKNGYIKTAPDESGRMTKVVERNIRALLERKQQEDLDRKTEDKVADAITMFAGSMAYVYIHIALYGIWVIWNLGWLGSSHLMNPLLYWP